jgi:hypothetical protein
MIQAYNFLGSWQLFPEKGTYEVGERPKSGLYKIESTEEKKEIIISHNWTMLDNTGYDTQYKLPADGGIHPFDQSGFADAFNVSFTDSISFSLHFYNKGLVVLHLLHEIMPNGYLKITGQGFTDKGKAYTNTELYHKQMRVMAYSASVAGAVVKATEEGVIRHKALTAMEEQTNMQLDQIRQQIELLALQAQEIHKRKELSMLIYGAKLSFKPDIGQTYYLYQKKDDGYLISLISPQDWGAAMPYKKFVSAVQLLADHTWREL